MKSSTTVKGLALYLSWLVGLILALLPFHAFLTVWLASSLGHYTALRLWKEFLLAVLVIGSLVLLAKDSALRGQFFGSKLTRLIIAYCALSAVWAVGAHALHKVTTKALGYGLIVNLRFLIFFLCVWIIATKSHWLEKVWPSLVLIPAAVVVLIGLIQRFILPYDVLKHFGYNSQTIYPYETINHNIHYQRVMSTLRGANPLGAYLILILSILSAVFVRIKRLRLWYGLFIIAALAVLFLSYSREAWIGLVFSWLLAFVLLKTNQPKQVFKVILVVVIVASAALGAALRHNSSFENVFFHTQQRSAVKESSNHAHLAALKGGLRDVVHEPLGRGVGTAGPASVYNDNKVRLAENYYIQVAQEVGWLGLVLFIAINYLLVKDLWTRRTNVLALTLIISFIGLVVVNFFSHAWTDDTLAYIWWGLAGIALATPSLHKNT